MTVHKSPGDRRREILDAARRRFVVDGYSRSRLGDIAADAGLSKGGLYFHFKSKRALFDALIELDFQRSMDALSLMRALQGSIADKLVFFARAGQRTFAADPDVARFQIVMKEMALAHEDIRARLQRIHDIFVREVSGLLGEGVASGELRPDFDVTTGAWLLVTLMDGLRGSIATGLLRGDSLERVIRDGAGLLTEGLLRHARSEVSDRAT